MKVNKQDLIELLDKASGLIDYVISELPDNDDDNDPMMYLLNAVGDLQDAVNLISDDDYSISDEDE